MGDWHYAGVSNHVECKTMIRIPVTILARQGSGNLGTCCSIFISGLPRRMPEDLLAAVLKLPVQLLKSGLYDAVLFSLLPGSCISSSSWKGKRMGLEKEQIGFLKGKQLQTKGFFLFLLNRTGDSKSLLITAMEYSSSIPEAWTVT